MSRARDAAVSRRRCSREIDSIADGRCMALVFFNDTKAPIECATEISAALKNHPDIQPGIGIHSGPVKEVLDVNERTNVAGAGIDIAQRVMDCGDAPPILLSKRVADDLAPYSRGTRLHESRMRSEPRPQDSLVNFYTDEMAIRFHREIRNQTTGVVRPRLAYSCTQWRKPVLLNGFFSC